MSKRKLPESETTERVARHAARRDAPPSAVRDLAGEQVDPRTRRKAEKAAVDALYDYVEIPRAAEAAGVAAEAAGGAGAAAAGAAAAGASATGAAAAGASATGAAAEAEPLRYPVLNVFNAWEALARESPDFQRLLQAKAAGGSLRLRFSVYGDEVTPGNPLAPDNRQRAYCFYISALEFEEFLLSEMCWFVLTVVPTVTMKTVKAGLSGFVRCLYRHLRYLQLGANIQLGGSQLFVHGAVSHCLYDAAALHGVLGSTGQSGNKPCFRCGNVYSRFKKLPPDADRQGLRTLNATENQLRTMTNEHIFEVVDHVLAASRTQPKTKVKQLVTDVGWNALEGSLLTDDATRREVPPLMHYFDPMHVFFVQGQFSRHVGFLLKALQKMGWTPDRIAEACTDDSIKHRRSTRKVGRAQFARELGDKYFTEDGTWKVSASSQLGAAPLLHFLIRFIVFPTVTCPDMKKELQAFLLLGSVLSLWMQIKFTPYGETVRKHAESAEALRNHAEALACRFQNAINAYIAAFHEVYGLEKMRPKTHYMLHLVQQYRDHCRMLDAFVLERKHRAAKTKIEHLSGKGHNSVVSVLHSLWSLQISEIREAQPFGFSCDGNRLDSGPYKIELGQVVWFPLHRKAGLVEEIWLEKQIIWISVKAFMEVKTEPGCLVFAEPLQRMRACLQQHQFLLPPCWMLEGNSLTMLF
ncbi:unnamed protein product [Symbiodinium sp. CCMP2592]|nr:unnamed protein product [Symbiodinium sp. CCMP2592]CAE7371417.1 unnamed protein product [Symbiodinium sp. CCMP2592]CAE7800134.1 unnamed protein product [Symbiodinium sp. CCMP2592]